ncbi:MAG TPA: glycosyltransferase [Candidatus Kaiserbacteria bacterium]|nr:glycosyltransferase [Candidatus Kaiserbacteria bacterium]
MKILFISNDPTIFEENSSARSRMRSYAEAIGELHILSQGAKTSDEQEGALFLHSIRPLPTKLGRVFLLWTLSRRAHRLVKKSGIEIVSAQDPFEHGAIAKSAVHHTNAKLHVQVHTDFCSRYFSEESIKNRLRMIIADNVLPHADGIRAVSNRVKNSLVARYGTRISLPVVIPIAMETKVANKSVEPFSISSKFSFMIMAVGRLEKEKRLEDAIRVVAILAKKKYPVALVIVGDGSEKEKLNSLAKKLGIEKRVMFLGWRNDIHELLSHAQAFIQTSAYEGYGRTYIEAALADVPMVVTNVGIIGDVFINKESALVCDVSDIRCLERSMETLIEENDTRYKITYNAHNVADAHIKAVGDTVARTVEDFERLLA